MSDAAGWPDAIDFRGVTESVVATLGPNDRWNVAALGLDVRARSGTESGDDGRDTDGDGIRITARTWGRTRTRRNFAREGGGVVQFVRDPELFARAALDVVEFDDPVLEAADAWVEIRVERIDDGRDGGTDWVEWALRPVESSVGRRVVPATNRGYAAVVEATVAASRLGVDAYEDDRLLGRLAYFESVVERCGGPAERRAMETIDDLTDRDWGRPEDEPF